MSTLSKLWSALKGGYYVGTKLDERINVSGDLATSFFNWMNPNDPRAKGEAIFKYGDKEVTGHGHVPTSEKSSDSGGKDKDVVQQDAAILLKEVISSDAPLQVTPQIIAPANNTLLDMGAGLSVQPQTSVVTPNTVFPQSSNTGLTGQTQGLAGSQTSDIAGSSLLTNLNQGLSQLPGCNSLFGQGQLQNGFSNTPGAGSNLNGSQAGGCFGVPTGPNVNPGGQIIGLSTSVANVTTGTGVGGPGFTR
jgi:hypothetical protein